MTISIKISVCVAFLLAFTPCILAFTTQRKFTHLSFSKNKVANHRNVQLAMATDPDAKKETTLDRITGPKLFKTVTNWTGIHAVPLVPLRVLTGLLMIHHGSEGEF
jgi:hypothetical protein